MTDLGLRSTVITPAKAQISRDSSVRTLAYMSLGTWIMQTIARLPLPLAMFLAMSLALGGAACAADSSDGGQASAQDLTAYDAVVKNGTKIETDTNVTATQSAKTHLVGFVKDRSPAEVQKQLLSIAKWTQIESDGGDKAFTASRVTSDRTTDGVRTIAATVTVSAGVDIQLGATAKTSDDDTKNIHIVNTAASRHWLAGTILDSGKLVIDVKLVPYKSDTKSGTIVDATIKVKMAQMEDRAPELANVLPMVFGWLKETTPASP